MRRGSGSESGSVVRHGSDDEDHGRHPWTAVDDDPAPGLRPNHPAGARGSGSHAPRFRNLKVDVDPAVLAADERSGFAREETGRPQDSEGKRESDDERKARQVGDRRALLSVLLTRRASPRDLRLS